MSNDNLAATLVTQRAIGDGPNLAHGLRFAARTDVGCIREHNEDSFHANGETGLWLVADGMGGQGGGDVASRIVASHMAAACTDGKDLLEAVRGAHQAVIAAGTSGEGSARMGSTIVALRSKGKEYEIAWVGDSRAYLWDGALQQLTKDHSLVQERLDRNLITPAEVANDPGRGVITQCLGPANNTTLQIGSVTHKWHRDEKILLCSDGLHEEVAGATLSAIVASQPTVEGAVSALIKAALEAGGPDNVTAILVSAPDDAPSLRRPGVFRRLLGALDPRFHALVLGAAAGLVAILGLLLVWLLRRS